MLLPAMLALASSLALAGIGRGEGNPADPPEPRYQVRCWQYGRLLFDLRGVEAPSKAAGGTLAMAAKTAGGRMQVPDVGQSTCLVEPELVPAPGGD
jgi:hypothetical protein